MTDSEALDQWQVRAEERLAQLEATVERLRAWIAERDAAELSAADVFGAGPRER